MFNKCIKKFVINRNDKAFYYGEVLSSDDVVMFKVYLTSGVVIYNSDSFYDIYGNDKILRVSSFLDNVKFSIITSSLDSDARNNILSWVEKIESKFSKRNGINPNLNNCKSMLISFLNYYNEIIVVEDRNEGIDFSLEYEKVKKFNQKREYNKNTGPIYYENYGIRSKQDIA